MNSELLFHTTKDDSYCIMSHHVENYIFWHMITIFSAGVLSTWWPVVRWWTWPSESQVSPPFTWPAGEDWRTTWSSSCPMEGTWQLEAKRARRPWTQPALGPERPADAGRYLRIVQKLLAARADAQTAGRKKHTALHNACGNCCPP